MSDGIFTLYHSGLHLPSEQLQVVPEQLDAQISSKRFLSAVNILQDALRLIRRSDLEDIGALGDLRIYFGNQEMVSVTFAACRATTDSVVSSH